MSRPSFSPVRLRAHFGVFRADELLVTVTLTYVNATRNEKKPAPVPAAFVDKIVAFEKKSPARK